MSFVKKHIEIILIALVGLVLRISIAGIHSYSNDELSAINRLSFDNFSDLIEFGVMRGDMHPAGVQVFMKLWTNLGGVNEFGMRFPFVMMGVLSIILVYVIGCKFSSKRTAIIASLFLALLYFPIMNSEFARPYSPGLFFSLLSAYFVMNILFAERAKWRDALLLGVSLAAAMYSHYFAFLFVGWIGFTALLFIQKHQLKYLLVGGLIALLLFAPHIGVTAYHLGVGGLQWLAPPEFNWLAQFLLHVFNDSYLLVGLVVTALVMALIFKHKRISFTKVQAFWTVLFFGIYLVGFVFSYLSTPVLKFPVMLFPLPFLFLLMGEVFGKSILYKPLLAIFSIAFLFSTVCGKDLFGNRHYELFKEPAQLITEWKIDYGAENIYTVYNLNNPNYMNFYANQWDDPIDFDWDVLEFGDAKKLREDLKNNPNPHLVIGYSARLTLPQVFESCLEFYPHIIEGEKYNNAAVYLLSKTEMPIKQYYRSAELADFNASSQRANWVLDGQYLRQIQQPDHGEITEGYLLKNPNIYGPEFHFTLNDIPNISNQYIKVLVSADLEEGDKLTASFSAKRNGEILQNRGENYWEGRDLEQMLIDKGHAYFTFKVPNFIEHTDDLMISFWNRNGERPILIKNIKVLTIDNIWN